MRKLASSPLKNNLVYGPSPATITYIWSFGFLAGICLFLQIISGTFMAVYYVPNVEYAFLSVEHVMRNVPNGWFFRYLHSSGASFFFFVVYCHIFRSLYLGSYGKPKKGLWLSGILIYVLMMVTAFIGYILPWGQMSFWGATVITNLFSTVPFVGDDLVRWLWGGFCVNNATLNKFFCMHFVLPFVIVALVLLHLVFLHKDGSGNPLGLYSDSDYLSFYPYFYVKDFFALFIMLSLLAFFIFFEPHALGHTANYTMANPQLTPVHIVPEWYFLPFYAMLRAVPSKIGGVFLMFGSIISLLEFSFKTSGLRNGAFNHYYQLNFWFFVFTFLSLGLLGQKPVTAPFTHLSSIFSISYFVSLYAMGAMRTHRREV
jgi:ubiquinol-cytochrome c reductase cytochrome b subunit